MEKVGMDSTQLRKRKANEGKSQVDVLAHSIDKVAHQYLNYIFDIHALYDESTTDYKPVYKQKFDEVRTELKQFLERNEQVACLKSLKFKHRKTNCVKVDFGTLTTNESFLEFDKFAEYYRQVKGAGGVHSFFSDLDWIFYSDKVPEFLKGIYGNLWKESSIGFYSPDRVRFLKYPSWKNTRCSYAQLEDKIKRRRKDLTSKTISKERIEELSFALGSINTSVDAGSTKCTICMEGFEVNQEVSRMPCGDFFHKDCIAKWFKLPEIPFCCSECRSAQNQVQFNFGYRPTLITSPRYTTFANFASLIQGLLDGERGSDGENNTYYDIGEDEPKFQCPNCRKHCC